MDDIEILKYKYTTVDNIYIIPIILYENKTHLRLVPRTLQEQFFMRSDVFVYFFFLIYNSYSNNGLSESYIIPVFDWNDGETTLTTISVYQRQQLTSK